MIKEYLEHEDVKYIEDSIITLAEQNNYNLSDNLKAIAKAKYRFFGVNDWRNCCCIKDGNHACISTQCKQDIEKDGICGCNLFIRKDL